jgi:DNA-binding MarR family transcriptional regulator
MTFRLHRLSNASQRFSEEYYRKLAGLSLVECRVIGILAELGTSTFGQVCETAGLDKSFGSRVVQRLTESGAIAKDGNPHDQRSVMLRLTDEGARLQNELHAAGRVLNQAMLADLSEDEALAFTTNLRRVAERLEKIEAAGVDAIPSAPAGVEACAPGVQLRLDTETAQTLYRMLGQTLRGNG